MRGVAGTASSSPNATAYDTALATTTAAYAVGVPIVMTSPDTSPPTAKPTLRSAPRNPNHFSRSPGTEIAATMLP